jgi:hypothetical protein
VLPICYEEIVQIGDTSTNYQIAAGDRIFVPTKCFLDPLKRMAGKKCDSCNKAHVPCYALPDGTLPHCDSCWRPAAAVGH